MTACKLYLILSAVAVVIIDRIAPIFTKPNAVLVVPLMLIGFFTGFILLQLLTLGAMILLTDIKKPPRGERFFRFLLKHSLPIIVTLARVKIENEGLEGMQIPKNALFVCNHQHDFDPVIIFSAFPDSEISFIGKKDIIEEMPLIAKAMHLLSCLFIDRENDREAAKTIISAIKYLKKGQKSIGLFPEGYCSKTGELLPLRNGSLKIALKSGVPVVVCVLNNTAAIPKNMFRKKTMVKFKIVRIIESELYQNMTTAELGEIIHNDMANQLAIYNS